MSCSDNHHLWGLRQVYWDTYSQNHLESGKATGGVKIFPAIAFYLVHLKISSVWFKILNCPWKFENSAIVIIWRLQCSKSLLCWRGADQEFSGVYCSLAISCLLSLGLSLVRLCQCWSLIGWWLSPSCHPVQQAWLQRRGGSFVAL